MTFFSKFRLSRKPATAEAVATPTPAETVEALRRRARHRLIGAAVLVLLAVILFPMIFDTQPRAVPVDVPIVIPDRNKAKPLALPASAPVSGAAAVAEPAAVEVTLPASSALPGAVPQPPAPPAPAPAAQPRVEAAPPAAREVEAPRARDLPNGREQAQADAGRFVVQLTTVYTDNAKARDVRRALEKAGLVTYAQALEPKDGQMRIRVRMGPFANKAEADKVLSRVQGMSLPASILSL